MISILGLLILLALGAAVGAILRRLMQSRNKTDGPVCGHCGYSTIGLVALTCPECGSDLRKVGIVPAGKVNPRNSGRWGDLVRYTLLLILPAMGIGGMMCALLPPVYYISRSIHLGQPSSKCFANAVVSSDVKLWNPENAVVPVKIEIQLNSSAMPVSIVVNNPRDYDLPSLLAWMKSRKIDTTRADVRREAAKIYSAIPEAADTSELIAYQAGRSSSGSSSSGGNRQFTSLRNNYSSSCQLPMWGVVSVIVFWIFIYLAGIYVIRRYWRTQVIFAG